MSEKTSCWGNSSSDIEHSDPEHDGLKEIEIMADVSDEEVLVFDLKSDGTKE